jgi:L-alanine-DL-glutamate epimerase-like enolase superfamily enzyme
VSRITASDCALLRLPQRQPLARLVAGEPTRFDHLHAVLVRLRTEAGLQGVGVVTALHGGRALLAAAEEMAAVVVGQDLLTHEAIAAHVRSALPDLPGGLFRAAYAAFDLAAWDAKGKAAGLPVWRLLGGAAESALAFAGDAAGPGLSTAEVLQAARPYRECGVSGLLVHLAGTDPEADVHRAEQLRDKLGDDVWVAVRGEDSYETRTALAIAHYIEDEVGGDWFERFLRPDDLDGHAKLVANIEVPIAVGGLAEEPATIRQFVEARACGLVRPDLQRLGGLTAWLAVASYARLMGRPVVPIAAAHVGVQLACALPGVPSVEVNQRLDELLGPVKLSGGRAIPSAEPGLGWNLSETSVATYRIA